MSEPTEVMIGAGVEKAVTHSLKTAVGEAGGHRVKALKEALGQAQVEMQQ